MALWGVFSGLFWGVVLGVSGGLQNHVVVLMSVVDTLLR